MLVEPKIQNVWSQCAIANDAMMLNENNIDRGMKISRRQAENYHNDHHRLRRESIVYGQKNVYTTI